VPRKLPLGKHQKIGKMLHLLHGQDQIPLASSVHGLQRWLRAPGQKARISASGPGPSFR
jgi:hypothetical protein